MDFNYLVFFISYLGLVFGVGLGINSPEELKPGRKYFLVLEKVLFVIIVGLLLYFLNVHIIFVLVIACIISIILYYMTMNSELIFFFLGIIIFLSSYSKVSMFIVSTLIFYIGLFTGTIHVDTNKKLFKTLGRTVLTHAAYFICIFLYALK